ncbi:hypothetical protein Rsub_00535 [Raphidocelis subcapitata]|uniref:Coenzyme Q-binding protein COQ10 START domain-containing protein n=1 Tax=Raphidocelis subcapitata TaxID=307507 RepID=A0A2V0NKH2_9CHLO|nr:hypothetical protein Rsub_00535 [Raphidocelis subcapitata]|eukprot:GBF87824.1 hypothetical protein Rsub_00535 [Raphidocelis subcapitata]
MVSSLPQTRGCRAGSSACRSRAAIGCSLPYRRCQVAPAAALAGQWPSELGAPAAPSSARGPVPVRIEQPADPSAPAVVVASTAIAAPASAVWDALTAYESLGDFKVPGLLVNRCLERRERGCVLYQVAGQDLPFGAQVRAACKLEVTEHPQGLPAAAMDRRPGAGGSRFPWPVGSLRGRPVHGDISFELLEGDFDHFKGLWRVQQGLAGPSSAWLSYALRVLPHMWLPATIVQGQLREQIAANMETVRAHVEAKHAAQARRE